MLANFTTLCLRQASKLSLQFILLAAAFAACSEARDDFPSRPITWVVPFPAGGPVDTLARIVTEPLSRLLRQPIVIENVSGAAGSIGVGRVARAPPDGYTLIQGIWSTHVLNGAVYSLSYDVLNDFAPIAHLTDASQIVVARKSMPADDLQGLIAWLQTNPDRALAGTAGAGSPQHVFGLLFQNITRTRFALYIIAVALPLCRIWLPSGSI
jgi:tripartite-type tricarboxylate transporter receptor subunit TctC